jgi:Na+-transporting NADH:ubiquinone oxidoreductase subunit A
MSKTVKLRKGLNINLVGEADRVKIDAPRSQYYAIKPSDFHGMTPKMVVKAGDKVKAGTIIFYNKYQEEVKFASPVSGEIEEIVRGAKRRILEVRIKADAKDQYESFGSKTPSSMTGEEVKELMLSSGLWPFVKQRPVDIVANPKNEPKAIFISAFDSSPLAPDYDFIVHGNKEAFQTGLDALQKLTSGKVHLTLNGKGASDEVFKGASGVQINSITGKHPAGNVGTQIHHIDPINKGEFVWVLNPQDVLNIGKSLMAGHIDCSKFIALTGAEVKKPVYMKSIIGASIKSLLGDGLSADNVRVISGNALCGTNVGMDGYVGFYDAHITVLPEGNDAKFLLGQGWLGSGSTKFSNSKAYFSYLMPSKKRHLDTNLNGEERGFVVTGELEKVFPFDIYPMQLIKSVMYNDIDQMEQLGIYELAPEDLALCEFVCTSKIEIQDLIRKGLDVIQEECL